MKYREWGDRDKERSDRRSTIPVANSSSECKEPAKEERDAERWERERRDTGKDKERLRERERDHTKKDPWNGVEKDGSNNEKEVGDGSIRVSEQEILPAEQKKQKDFDSWRNVDRESRDRRKKEMLMLKEIELKSAVGAMTKNQMMDVQIVKGLQTEIRKFVIMEFSSVKGCNGQGVALRWQIVSCALGPALKTMKDPKVCPCIPFSCNKNFLLVKFCRCKNEVSSVVYKVGECMQELIKLWKEYEVSQGEKNESSLTGPTLEIRIPAEHVTATNRQVRGGQLWGTDIYTDDSDLVAVLMHTGYCRPTASPPPPAIQELRATVRVLPPQDCYISTLRNNVRSRAWGAAIGCSYRVERCCIVKKAGGTIDLEPCLTHTSTVEPTLAPVIVERTMTTRAAASNALRQQRFVREVTIQYNLCNEPWIKYSISIVADKGLKKTLYTSARLKKGEVLYLETHSRRYELCFTGEKMVKATQLSQMHEGETEKSQNHVSHSTNGERNDSDHIMIDVFRWSRCKTPLPQKVTRSVGIPLPLEYVEVLEENLDWEDVQWSQTGVWIAGKEYTLARVHFLSTN
ncbi:zinc finger CCCH domain-containing protein 13 isoform X1 [Prunus yedoensis var. nudiflora]|uniref:Zinc finger CCCH domain-containing protein 13 isoform X1 n=1 Tax=Prunus yedoensis var. nudiflora TaxID=2094558 RepID=A0A314UNL8_PRUYE|nr:zinc finger CCCH domain-containing protein 13 isoform X1 [Prunus yedoensis var. nudiflora]